MNVERIVAPPDFDGSEGLLAILVTGVRTEEGMEFVTEETDRLQVGVACREAGYVVAPHIHREQSPSKQSAPVGEVLAVRRGALRASFYTSRGELVTRRLVQAGDILVLVGGGHGFEAVTETEFVEVKSGPYAGRESDKVHFRPVE